MSRLEEIVSVVMSIEEKCVLKATAAAESKQGECMDSEKYKVVIMARVERLPRMSINSWDEINANELNMVGKQVYIFQSLYVLR